MHFQSVISSCTKLATATLVAVLFARIAAAGSTPPDWMLYEESAVPRGNLRAAFYLDTEIVPEAPGLVQVWIEYIDEPQLAKLVKSLGQNSLIRQRAAAKIADHYVPPLATIHSLIPSEIMRITLFEQAADYGSIRPSIRLHIEIDCGRKLFRELSYVRAPPATGSSVITDWASIDTGSTKETLRQLTCEPK